MFKKFFKKEETKEITLGERDENGFCDTYIEGEKTNLRMLVFTEKEANKLFEEIKK